MGITTDWPALWRSHNAVLYDGYNRYAVDLWRSNNVVLYDGYINTQYQSISKLVYFYHYSLPRAAVSSPGGAKIKLSLTDVNSETVIPKLKRTPRKKNLYQLPHRYIYKSSLCL